MSTSTRARYLISERDWQQLVVDFAKLNGWFCYHTLRSLGSEAGWPDLVLIRTTEIVFAELKREDGKLRPAQARVLELLEAAGCETHCWRPSDEGDVFARLRRQR